MVEEAVVGARGGGDQIGNGTRVANLPERGSSLAARGGLVLFHHADQAVDRIAVARHANGSRSGHTNAEISVIEGGANARFSRRRADPVERPNGGGARFVGGRL